MGEGVGFHGGVTARGQREIIWAKQTRGAMHVASGAAPSVGNFPRFLEGMAEYQGRQQGCVAPDGFRAPCGAACACGCSPEPLRALSRSRDGCLHVCSYLLAARVSSGSREALMAEQALSVLLTALPSAPEWQVSNTCLARIETDFK